MFNRLAMGSRCPEIDTKKDNIIQDAASFSGLHRDNVVNHFDIFAHKNLS